jgi:hypothetical protein
MEKEVLSLKIEPELKTDLQRLATEDFRTLSNYILMVLTRHVQKKQKQSQE